MDTIETIMRRRSIRRYKPGEISQVDLDKILESGRQAPSAANRQPWHFVVVRDQELKRKVAAACSGQNWLADAYIILAGIGSPGASRGSTGHPWYEVDVSIAMQNMILAATSLGYGTCWIGAFDEAQVKTLLKVPEEMRVVALTPIGVPDASPDARPRKDFNQVFSAEQYGQPMNV
ncbi:TPA: nitroreductase [Candidatus Poribacteria bacterium]|nr:nitroreductase [Candidatus Poribacteria bacterium]